MKKIDKPMILSTIVCLLPMAMALILWNDLPDQLPIHFSSGGADNFMSKSFVGIGIPCIFAAVNIVCQLLTNSETKVLSTGRVLKLLVRWLCSFLSVLFVPVALVIGLGRELQLDLIAYTILGFAFIPIGNLLPKCTRNNTLGFRLPWTLSSDTNWNKTHRLAGALCILGGVFFLFAAWFSLSAQISISVLLVLCAVIPGVYSYILYKKGV